MPDNGTLLRGRYRLQETLGEGGMATVHRAYDHHNACWVAIKLLAPAVARRLSVQRRFAREAEVLRRLNHPNIVQLYDWQPAAEESFLVMEFVDGGSLDTWSRRFGPMSPRMAVQATLQICSGVGAAHAAGIIHRDIKPANVLTTAAEQCKVVDFGLARAGDHERLTKAGLTMGTYGFMAPEQNTDAATATILADIYSIGATLIALLNGRPHLDIRQALNAVSSQLPLSLARVLVNTTLAEPSKRYSSIDDLYRALQRALKHLSQDTPVQPLHVRILHDDEENNPTITPNSAEETIFLDD